MTAPSLTPSRSQPISLPRLKALRSTLLAVIVSLLVLAGYAHAVADKCCDAQQAEHSPSAPGEDDGCQCLCHKVFSNVSPMPARLPVLVLVLQTVRLHAAEFPPDAEPQSIDHPPQLA